MSNVTELQQALLDATKLLSNKSVSEAKYAYTIKCTIKGIEDAGLNLYKVEYGANAFNAYANNGVNYKVNDIVYVLVPDGDFTQQMQIIGSSAPKASMYVTEQESDTYVSITENLFGEINQVDLKSWENSTGTVSFDTSNFNLIFKNYLESGNRNFKFTAKVKTEIDKDHQMKGNYGLILNLPFIETSTAGGGSSTAVWRSYVMDVNSMQGNVYNFTTFAKQDLYYDIDESLTYDVSRQPYISSFVTGFEYLNPRTDIDSDIHIKDIGIEMVDVLTVTDAQGYSLRVVASAGNYFLAGKYAISKTLTPVLKVKGKTVSNLNKWDCYWFVEDTSINISSDGYLNLGGLGWKCLNKKTNVTYDASGKMNYQYVTNNYTYNVKVEDVKSKLRYKCVLVQDDVVVGGSICLTNLNSGIKMELVSATGSNYFVENTGYVNLIARIYYPDMDPSISISSAWQRFDKNDNYLDDNFYEIVRYNDPVDIIDTTGTSHTWLETEIKYPCSKLEQLNTVNCTFYSTTVFNGTTAKSNLGTSSIIVATTSNFTYGVTIDGGDVLYKYDADGDSPLVANYDGPLSSRVKNIQPITYRVYKADGTQLTDTEYLYCKYKWSFPKNSMMKLTGYTSQQLDTLEQDDEYYYIIGYGKNSINYTILNTYNKKKNNNTIILSVEFAGDVLSSSVSPKFLKDGESGTNGTKYSAVIVYGEYGYGERDSNNKIRKLQLVYVNNINSWRLYNINTQTLIDMGTPQLTAQVYADGERLTSGYSVNWKMFDNASSSEGDTNETCFAVDNSGRISVTKNWSDLTNLYTNVVRAEIKVGNQGETNGQEVIYAYYPLEITWLNTSLSKVPTLAGGFDEVLYAADGTNPEYDSSEPFECIDNLYNDTTDYYSYTWTGCSNLKIPSSGTYQKKITPITKFDNGVSKNYVKVTLEMNATQRSNVNTLINNLTAEITQLQNMVSFYQHEKQHLLDFLQKFDYNYYVSILNNSKTLLSYRYQDIQIINNLYQVIENINDYCRNNNIQIRDFNYTTYYTSCRNALDSAKHSLYNLINTGGFNALSNLSSALITLNEVVKDKYGVAVYSQLKALVDEWNGQIVNNYQPIYTKLVAQTTGRYILQDELTNLYNNLYTKLVSLKNNTDLNYLANSHDGSSASQEYINLKNQISTLIDYLTSIDGELYSYNDIDEKLLRSIRELLKIYNNTDYQNQRYSKINTALTNDLIELTNQKDGYQKALLPNNSSQIVHIKPIVMTYNRYELSHINGWDGNKLYVDSTNNQYLFMPQVGAGIKNSNNTFTGLVMGVKKFNNSSTQHIGLFGYSQGQQSIFLNAEDGSAILGKSSGGQIIADPSQSKALLYSSNYWKNYKNDGKPTSYDDSNKSGQGMKIDLSTPEIRFGNGNFVVNSSGHITAKGGGSIAGWNIADTKLYSNKTESAGRITLESTDTGKIYSYSHSTLDMTNRGFYLSSDGLSIGNTLRVTAAEGGYIELGRLSSTSRKWTISGDASNSYISYGTSGSNGSVYIGTNEITLGSKFSVTAAEGKLTARDCDISGKITAGEGEIGGWTINTNSLSSEGITISSNGNISGDGFGGGSWSINRGKATFNNIEASGKIIATEGQIGGWTINEHSLSSGNITISSQGSIKSTGGQGWEINSDGYAKFTNVWITGVNNGSEFGGLTYDLSGQTKYNSTASNPFEGNCVTHIENITANTITAEYISGKAVEAGLITADNINSQSINTSQLNADSIDGHRVTWSRIRTITGWNEVEIYQLADGTLTTSGHGGTHIGNLVATGSVTSSNDYALVEA